MSVLRQCKAIACNETRLGLGPYCSRWCEETTAFDGQSELEKAFLEIPSLDLEQMWELEMSAMRSRVHDYEPYWIVYDLKKP